MIQRSVHVLSALQNSTLGTGRHPRNSLGSRMPTGAAPSPITASRLSYEYV